MKDVLLRYLEGSVTEEEFEKLFDYIKEKWDRVDGPILREQWDELDRIGHKTLFDRDKRSLEYYLKGSGIENEKSISE